MLPSVSDVKFNGEAKMSIKQTAILILSTLIAVVVALAAWNLVLKVLSSIVSTGLDLTDYTVFQILFGLIFTVIIALEFKRSLFVIAEQQRGIVQVRTVILIALLTIVRKLMIIDLTTTQTRNICVPSRPQSWPSEAFTGWSETKTGEREFSKPWIRMKRSMS
jgi:uncharacterized membrane protein (DUF373 family)